MSATEAERSSLADEPAVSLCLDGNFTSLRDDIRSLGAGGPVLLLAGWLLQPRRPRLGGTRSRAYDVRMSDESIAQRIERLVAEEHALLGRQESDRKDADSLDIDRERLRAVEVELDRCWDLLRQRRALRGVGGDPEEAHVRDASTVEHYLQ